MPDRLDVETSALARALFAHLMPDDRPDAAQPPSLSDAKLALLAQLLGADAAPTAGNGAPPARPAAIPLTFAQELLWVLDRAHPGMSAYNSGFAGLVRGTLDLGALQRALDTLVVRHEALRTTYHDNAGAPMQVIAAPRPVIVTVAEPAAPSHDDRLRAALSAAREALRAPFDLTSDLMLRATVVRVDDDEHVIAIASHHIAADGWTRGILSRELGTLYAGYARGQAPALPVAPQFADFAIAQREELRGAALEPLLAYWRTALDGAETGLALPADFPRPQRPSFDGARAVHELDASLRDAVHGLAQQHAATTFTVLLAAYHTVLHRWTDQTSIVTGSPVAGRPDARAERAAGYFANMVATRSELADDPPFATLLERTRVTATGAFDHQRLPLDMLALDRHQDDGTATAPLLQATFAMDVSGTEALSWGAASFSPVSIDTGTTKFDVSLFAAERSDGIRLTLEYRTDILSADSAARLLRHLEITLRAVVADPAVRLSRVRLVSAHERRLLLEEWNDTEQSYPRDATVHELVVAHAARTPGALAVVASDGGSMTYAELDARSNRLARHLAAAGAGRDTIIAVCMEPTLDLVVALLATLKTGAAYLALDPAYPAERLAFMLEDSGAAALVVARPESHPLPDTRARIVALSADAGAIGALPETPLPSTSTGGDTANLVYTSGSTGQPKGVRLPHRGIVRLVTHTNAMQLTGDDVVAQVASPAFDALTWEVWGALLNGARLALMPHEVVLDPDALRREIPRAGVTTLLLTTAVFNQVARVAPDALRGVKYAFFGGEAADAGAVRTIARFSAPTHLINAYGPCETSVIAMTHEIGSLPESATTVPIGRPISNTRVYVLDKNLALVPIGMPGELCIGGDGVADGYRNRPELTAEKFVADPFTHTVGARLYRTGDLARWRPDGTIEFIGRRDNQVKLRGVRIELSEIEGVVTADPAVAEALALVRDVAPGDARLVCYFVPRAGEAVDVDRIRAALQRALPHNMLPSALVPLEAFPLTRNGKIDRNALPAPAIVAGSVGASYVPPRTTIEHQLVQIWERLLERSPIGIQDEFFDAGGHSLLAVRMLADVERVSGRRLPLATLFDEGTIEHLAARIEGAVHDEDEPPLIVLQREGALRPLIFVHGDVRGGGWYCRRLAPLIDPDRPLIVLPTMRLADRSVPHSIEAMAARHIAAVRAVQPRGPYYVAGFCAGGNIAVEIASQLHESGEQVERLILIDTIARNSRFRRVRWLIDAITADSDDEVRLDMRSRLLTSLRYYFNRADAIGQLPWRERVHWLRSRAKLALGRGGARASADDTATNAARAAEFHARPGTETLRMQARAVNAYISRGTPPRIDLIVALDPSGGAGSELTTAMASDSHSPESRKHTRGWERVAGAVHVYAIAGTHVGLITDQIGALAARLRECLPESAGTDD